MSTTYNVIIVDKDGKQVGNYSKTFYNLWDMSQEIGERIKDTSPDYTIKGYIVTEIGSQQGTMI